MKQVRKKKTASAKRPEEVVLARVRRCARRIGRDQAQRPELFEDVCWMVDHEFDYRIHRMLETEELSEEGREAIEMALEEAGFRLHLPYNPALGQKSAKDEGATPSVVIPFAVMFALPMLERRPRRLPDQISAATKQAITTKAIHRLLGCDSDTKVVLDPHLYHIDEPEWRTASITRRYLKSIAASVSRNQRRFGRLVPPVTESSIFEASFDSGIVFQRVICGAVVVRSDPDCVAGLVAQMFEWGGSENGVSRFREVAELIRRDLESQGVETHSLVFVYPAVLELWEVPEEGVRLLRGADLSFGVDIAMARLLESTPSGETVDPVLYVSAHGLEGVVEELRLAAYASEGAAEAFFTFDWELLPELEDPDDVVGSIREVATLLKARPLWIEGLLEDARCEECGAKLYCGPSGPVHGVDEDCEPMDLDF